VDPLAVVVNRNRQLLFGRFLPDHVLVKKLFDLEGLGNLVGNPGRRFDPVVLQYGVAYSNTLVANICARIVAGGRDELSDYVLTLMAKRTPQSIIGSGTLHAIFSYTAVDLIPGDWPVPDATGVGNNSVSSPLSPERRPLAICRPLVCCTWGTVIP
jgi:hypothetical protein